MAASNQDQTSASHTSTTNASIMDCLPDEVVTCLQNSRFLHLATCTQNRPHVSLMNYTYLPPSTRPHTTTSPTSPQLPLGPTIIMTSSPSSKKTLNLLANPNVSLLVHDWVSSRPPAVCSSDGTSGRDRSPTGARQSSLANMLMQMNTAAVSSISATMNGDARVLEPGSEEERWCKEQHLANNTFGGEGEEGDGGVSLRTEQQQRSLSLSREGGDGQGGVGMMFGTSPMMDGRQGDGGRGRYIENEDVRVVVVRITDGRISDWKGGVRDWVIREGEEEDGGSGGGGGTEGGMVNGV